MLKEKLRAARERLVQLEATEADLEDQLGKQEQALGQALAEGEDDPSALRQRCGELRSELEATRHGVAHLRREVPALVEQVREEEAADAQRQAENAAQELWAKLDKLEGEAGQVLERVVELRVRTKTLIGEAAEAERTADKLNGRRTSPQPRVLSEFRKRYDALPKVQALGLSKVGVATERPQRFAPDDKAAQRLGLTGS